MVIGLDEVKVYRILPKKERSSIQVSMICENCRERFLVSLPTVLRRGGSEFVQKCHKCKISESKESKEEIQNFSIKTYSDLGEYKEFIKSCKFKKTWSEGLVTFNCEVCGKETSVAGSSFSKSFLLQCPSCKGQSTNLEKYGFKTSFSDKVVQDKVQKRLKETYGGVGLQSPTIKQKAQKTCLETYGSVNPLSKGTDSFLKRNDTVKSKYGCDNVFQSSEIKDKIKKAVLEKYGVENPFQSSEIKEKIKQTNLEKYGVESYSQTKEHSKNHRSMYYYDSTNFDSSWELAYYIYCVDNQISIEVHPTTIPYTFENHQYYYQPDFLINNSDLIEIKGDQFFNENNELINPFDKSELSRKVSLEKQKCMIENNVTILRNKDLKHIFEYVDSKYGKNYLNQFKKK